MKKKKKVATVSMKPKSKSVSKESMPMERPSMQPILEEMMSGRKSRSL